MAADRGLRCAPLAVISRELAGRMPSAPWRAGETKKSFGITGF
jgi:hypothetical protein